MNQCAQFLPIWERLFQLSLEGTLDSVKLLTLLFRRGAHRRADDLGLHQVFLEHSIDFLQFLTSVCVVIDQSVVLFDDVGDLGGCETVGEDLCLRLYFLHKVAVFRDHLADFPLQVCPNLLLVLYDVLCLVQLVFQIINLVFVLFASVLLLLFEVCQHLLKDEDLSHVVISDLVQVIYLLLHGLLTILVSLETRLHLCVVPVLYRLLGGRGRGCL